MLLKVMCVCVCVWMHLVKSSKDSMEIFYKSISYFFLEPANQGLELKSCAIGNTVQNPELKW